jgi:hypothetical protein
VLAIPMSTDRRDCFCRKARRSASTALGVEAVVPAAGELTVVQFCSRRSSVLGEVRF